MNTSRLRPLGALFASLALVAVAGASAVGAAPESKTVTIDNFAFAPADLTVSAGSTVTWKNVQNARHTTTADFGEWDSSIITNGQSFDVTFAQPGDFSYHCDIHEEKVGVVHVVADSAPPAVAEAPAIDAQDEPVLDLGAVTEAPAQQAPAPVTSPYGY